MRRVAIIPAFQAATALGPIVQELLRLGEKEDLPILVVDDGSTDATSEVARRAGARPLRHEVNRGKGAALKTGLRHAFELGADVAVSLDADGQHPASEAWRVLCSAAPPEALVLGVRELRLAGAPRPSRFSNEFSNVFLSWFSGRRLDDTQCGLRRYPVGAVLDLDVRANGYAFEAEVVLRAARRGIPIVQEPIRAVYGPEHRRGSHFRVVRDPAKIVFSVVKTALTVRSAR